MFPINAIILARTPGTCYRTSMSHTDFQGIKCSTCQYNASQIFLLIITCLCVTINDQNSTQHCKEADNCGTRKTQTHWFSQNNFEHSLFWPSFYQDCKFNNSWPQWWDKILMRFQFIFVNVVPLAKKKSFNLLLINGWNLSTSTPSLIFRAKRANVWKYPYKFVQGAS